MRASKSRHLAIALVASATTMAACKSDDPREERVPPPRNSALAAEVAALEVGREAEIDPGVFMTKHRVGATAPIDGGWHRAESAAGGFSVELPLAFNDFSIRSKATDGVDVKSHTLGAKSPGLLSWMATCVVRRDGSPPPDASGEPDRTEVQGFPPRAYVRTLRSDGQTCLLVVEAQGTDPLPSDADRQRFLASFRRLRPPRW